MTPVRPVRPLGLESSTLPLSHCAPYQKIVEEKKKKKAQEEQQQPKQPLSSASKVSLDDFDQGVVRRTIASMYSLKKVLPTLDNIRTELKQSIDYKQHWQRGSSPSYEVCLHTLWGESKSSDEETRCSPQQDQISSHCRRDSTTEPKIPFSKGNLRIVELHDPWVCTINTI